MDWALAVARDVSLALEALHAVGVMHRDIKPDNILMRNERYPVLVDFGIATRNRSALQAGIAGTRAYMPPELLLGHSDRGRGDVFGTAVVLAEMLGGTLPAEEGEPSYWGAWQRQKSLLRFADGLHLETDLPQPAIQALLADAIRFPLFARPMSSAEFAEGLAAILAHR